MQSVDFSWLQLDMLCHVCGQAQSQPCEGFAFIQQIEVK